MHRLDRRRIVLEGKRQGAFDANQYYFEGSTRTRLMRRARVLLRAGRPLVVTTPRWSSAETFLDDLATDVALGEPSIKARPLSLHALRGLTVHQAWAWLASAVSEFCQVSLLEEEGVDRPLWQAVSRRGFREVLSDLLDRAEGGRRRCLMVHGLEHAHVDAVNDLFDIFGAHLRKHGPQPSVSVLFAGAPDAPYLELPQASHLHLDDYSPEEAVNVLVEYWGPQPAVELEAIADIVGGVPALLEALGQANPAIRHDILTDHTKLWSALGPLGGEIRVALEIVHADSELSSRLERLSRLGSLPTIPVDMKLVQAGLVRADIETARTEIRSPWFAAQSMD